MRGGDAGARAKIRDGPRHLENSVIGARRNIEAVRRLFEQSERLLIGLAVALDAGAVEARIAHPLAILLQFASAHDAYCNLRSTFNLRGWVAQELRGHARYFDMHVEPIEQRT